MGLLDVWKVRAAVTQKHIKTVARGKRRACDMDVTKFNLQKLAGTAFVLLTPMETFVASLGVCIAENKCRVL